MFSVETGTASNYRRGSAHSHVMPVRHTEVINRHVLCPFCIRFGIAYGSAYRDNFAVGS